MKSRRPKPLHEICGRPMLEYILRACWGAGCGKVIVVVGYGKEEVMAQFAGDDRIQWVEQAEQLGTGHAVRCAEAELKQVHGEVFILAGDVPLIRGQVLKTLLKAHREEKVVASMATAILDEPTGYGRIVRDENGEFVRIVEQVDCLEEQREIKEVFPSYYCVRAEELIWALGQLKNDNKKGEFYLTDIYEHIRKSGKRVLAVQAVTAEDVLAPNSRQDLAMADMVMQDRIQREHREAGVSIVSSINTYIEDGASIGADTTVLPFSFIGRDASIGHECIIGPFGFVPRNSVVREGTTVAGNVTRETALLQVEP